jgi:hypothetical protein
VVKHAPRGIAWRGVNGIPPFYSVHAFPNLSDSWHDFGVKYPQRWRDDSVPCLQYSVARTPALQLGRNAVFSV